MPVARGWRDGNCGLATCAVITSRVARGVTRHRLLGSQCIGVLNVRLRTRRQRRMYPPRWRARARRGVAPDDFGGGYKRRTPASQREASRAR